MIWIVDKKGVLICKYGLSFVKRYTMFPLVSLVLIFVPFKAYSCHTYNVSIIYCNVKSELGVPNAKV